MGKKPCPPALFSLLPLMLGGLKILKENRQNVVEVRLVEPERHFLSTHVPR
jgi:hypothetical protein